MLWSRNERNDIKFTLVVVQWLRSPSLFGILDYVGLDESNIHSFCLSSSPKEMPFFSLIPLCFRVLILPAKEQEKGHLECHMIVSHEAMITSSPALASILNINPPMPSFTFRATHTHTSLLLYPWTWNSLFCHRALMNVVPLWNEPNSIVHLITKSIKSTQTSLYKRSYWLM